MSNKITLITPPDIFENSNVGILTVDMNQADQDEVSTYLGEYDGDFELNLYVFNGEPDIPWLFHALNVSKYVYINLDSCKKISTLLAGYILSKPNVYWNSSDVNIKALYSHINQKTVNSVSEFFEKVLNERKNAGV